MFSGTAKQKDEKVGAKKGIDMREATARRQKRAVTLREKARRAALETKRAKGTVSEEVLTLPEEKSNPMAYSPHISEEIVPFELLPAIAALIDSPDPNVQLQCAMLVRKFCEKDRPPIDGLVQLGLLARMILFLQADNRSLQEEGLKAIYCLSEAGLSPGAKEQIGGQNGPAQIVLFLTAPDARWRAMAANVVGHLTEGTTPLFRDYIMKTLNAFPLLMEMLRHHQEQEVEGIQNAVFAIRSFASIKPFPPFAEVAQALSALVAMLDHHSEHVVEESLWALSFISDHATRIRPVMQMGVLPKVVRIVETCNDDMLVPAVRLVGNFAQGDDDLLDQVLNTEMMCKLPTFLQYGRAKVVKEACWMVSNIAAGTADQITWLCNSGILPYVVPLLSNPDLGIRREAMWTFTNALEMASLEQANYLLSTGFLDPYCQTLQLHDEKLRTVALSGLEYLLLIGEKVQHAKGCDNPFIDLLIRNSCVSEIENLSESTSKVSDHAVSVLEFFEGNGTDELFPTTAAEWGSGLESVKYDFGPE